MILSIKDYIEITSDVASFFGNIGGVVIDIISRFASFFSKSIAFFFNIFIQLYDILFNDIFNNLPLIFKTGLLSLIGVFLTIVLFKFISLIFSILGA